ncbi:MAG: hydrogenase maturation protease [Anaerolineae bacterium]|nr:hydrogenase maturation protease [Anaerolineae bacterium]
MDEDTITDTIVVGLGNPILSDDGVGWQVVQRLRDTLNSQAKNGRSDNLPVHVTESRMGGLLLAEMMIGYRRAVIVDAIITGECSPGTVVCCKLEDLPGDTLNTSSAHDTNLVTALEAVRRFGGSVPVNGAIDIVAVEVQDVWTLAEQCTPEIQQSIPSVVAKVMELLD